MTKTTDAKKDNPDLQRFVFGLDADNKPVGARFPTSETKVFEVVKARKLELSPGVQRRVGSSRHAIAGRSHLRPR